MVSSVSEVANLKKEMRQLALQRRKTAHEAQTEHPDLYLKAFLENHPARNIAGYMPIRTEISPITAMAEAEKRGSKIGVPVIRGEGMPLWFAQWHPNIQMVPGPFGAEIPANAVIMTPDIIIVPLVAFSASGARLGYGGGFYDRTLEQLRATNRNLSALGFAYSAQEMENLPQEATDQPLDAIITEKAILEL